MSNTPRTDEFFFERSRSPGERAWLKYAKQLEVELNAANKRIQELEGRLRIARLVLPPTSAVITDIDRALEGK